MILKFIDKKGFDEIEKRCKAENRKITEIISKCTEQGIYYIDDEIMPRVVDEYKKEGIQAVPLLAFNKRKHIIAK